MIILSSTRVGRKWRYNVVITNTGRKCFGVLSATSLFYNQGAETEDKLSFLNGIVIERAQSNN